MTSLPVINGLDAASDACSRCHGPCCFEHDVEVYGYDLMRLVRGLGVPWRALVRVETHPHRLFFGFRLDASSQHYHFFLRRRESGACQLLLELADDHRRCGAHALRPGACRIYPFVSREDGPQLGGHASCPDGPRALYEGARTALGPLVDEDDAEMALWIRVCARWDLAARRVSPTAPLPMDAFLEWLFAAYDTLAPLRAGSRGDWQLAAYARVDELPLPPPP